MTSLLASYLTLASGLIAIVIFGTKLLRLYKRLILTIDRYQRTVKRLAQYVLYVLKALDDPDSTLPVRTVLYMLEEDPVLLHLLQPEPEDRVHLDE